MKDSGNLLFCILAVVMLSGLTNKNVFSQKSVREIENEYRNSVRDYMDDLQGSFARRYIANEQYLLDMIVVLTEEFVERKSKGSLRKGQVGSVNLGLSLEEVRGQMNQIADQMVQLRVTRQMAATDSIDDNTIRTMTTNYERVYAKEYELTRMKGVKLRDQLLKMGGESDTRRMLQAQLKAAFVRYLQQEYETAVIGFTDILNTYTEQYKEWDDVLYYLAECYFQMGDMDNAETTFSKVIAEYPSSKYTEKAFTKLFGIAYIRTDRPKMNKYLGDFETRVTRQSKNQEHYDRMIFMAGLTFFDASDYMKAKDVFAKIPTSSKYYNASLFMTGHCYANREDYYNAIDFFQKVVDQKISSKTPNQEQHRQMVDIARMKIAFIQFEQALNGQKMRSVYPNLRQIREDSEIHDLALLTVAWSSFKDNNIDTSRMFIDSLIRNYPASEYIYEAKTLRGNIDVLDPNLTDRERELIAIESYNFVATAMEAKYISDDFIAERDSAYNIVADLNEARQIAAVRKDTVSFMRYNTIFELLTLSTSNNGFAKAVEDNPRNTRLYHYLGELVSQLRIAQGKLKDAEEAKNLLLVKKIQKQINRLIERIEALGLEQSSQFIITGQSVSDSGAIARRNQIVKEAKDRIALQKEQLSGQISTTQYALDNAKRANQDDEAGRLQLQLRELNQNMTQLTEHEAWINSIGILDIKTLKKIAGSNYVDKSLQDIIGNEFASVSFDNYSNIEMQAYFTQHRMARIASEIEARNKKMNILREKAGREKEQVLFQISSVEQMIKQAEQQNRLESQLKLSHYKNRLIDIYNQICDYEIMIGAQPTIESYSDLSLWGDFAIYGKNNITYVINTTKTENIQDLGRAITQIDNILITRRKNYETKIAKLEEEIKLKEQEIRDKELKEMRSSQKQFFDKEYFEGKESEQPENDPFEYKDIQLEVITVVDTLEGKEKKKKSEEGSGDEDMYMDDMEETGETGTGSADSASAGTKETPGDSVSTGTKETIEEGGTDHKDAGTDTTSAGAGTDTTSTGAGTHDDHSVSDTTTTDENTESPYADHGAGTLSVSRPETVDLSAYAEYFLRCQFTMHTKERLGMNIYRRKPGSAA